MQEGTTCEQRQESRREPNPNTLAGSGRDGTAPSPRWPNEVVITKVSNGFIVRIGCQTFVGKDWDDVSNGLDLYWIHPEKAEQLYLGKK